MKTLLKKPYLKQYIFHPTHTPFTSES